MLSADALRILSEWQQYYDENAGGYYYYNSVTGEARWEAPHELIQAQQQQYEIELYWQQVYLFLYLST